MLSTNGSRFGASAAVIGIMALTLVLLLLRNSGVYPTVFGDEYSYSSMSRLMPLSAASIPNYLYLSIYRATLMCGDGFMNCTKLLNVLFFVASAPFIYLTARRYCSKTVAVVIVGLGMLGPINGYTAYFMPEALFFLTFWISVCYFLSLDARASLQQWALFGFIMGCASLVKPHAMFVIPAFCLCIMFFAYKSVDNWFTTGAKSAVVFVLTMMLTKWGFSFAVAGKAGLTLFGNFYASTLESNASSLQRYLDILLAAPHIASGHLLGNTVMFGCALAVLLCAGFRSLVSKGLTNEDKLAFCALFLLLNLVAVVALFSASVAGSNAIETALRLHMRYYDFIFPLLFIAAGAQLNSVQSLHRHLKLAVVLAVAAAIIYAGITRMHPFTLSFIDNPELRGYTLNKKVFVPLALLSLACVVLWYRQPRRGISLFLFVYLPLSVLVTAVTTNASVRDRLEPDTYDKAGQFARQYLPLAERSQLLVVGDNPASILRALFWVEDLNAGPDLSYKPGVVYTAAQTPADKKWILVVGDVQFAKGDFKVLKLNGFSLARKVPNQYPIVLDFRSSMLPESIDNLAGMSHAESWGAWSDAEEVVVEFARPLPKVFDLSLNAKAYGPNTGKAFAIKVDGQVYPLTLNGEMAPYTIRINNPDEESKLVIKVPAAVSPQQLGVSTDSRLLGMGVDQFTITPVQ
ncbi:phosphoglycerol transferase [Pantoea sp. Tr-811]|nr:phosphoglycerol transferase [Pantoea sp. Tr-811]